MLAPNLFLSMLPSTAAFAHSENAIFIILSVKRVTEYPCTRHPLQKSRRKKMFLLFSDLDSHKNTTELDNKYSDPP